MTIKAESIFLYFVAQVTRKKKSPNVCCIGCHERNNTKRDDFFFVAIVVRTSKKVEKRCS